MNATHTTESTMQRRIEWTNSKGTAVAAVIELRTSKTVDADGDRVTVPCCEWTERVEQDGHPVYGVGDIESIEPRSINGVTVSGRWGSTGIPAEQMALIEAARTELRATPEWAAHTATMERNKSEVEEYEEHARRMDRQDRWTY